MNQKRIKVKLLQILAEYHNCVKNTNIRYCVIKITITYFGLNDHKSV